MATAAMPPASSASSPSAAAAAAHASQSRPLDQLGPPSEPIAFPRPQLLRGRRGTVLCYNSTTKEHEVLNNVLFRDFGRNAGGTVRHAYWKIPYKEPIQTIMGHVEMCRVLDRSTRQHDDDSSCEAEDGDNYDTDDDDDEIVFEWTDKCVAVKVNYTDRMDRLRDQHAENPLQEIAAMQLLGEEPLHVLGAMEVLFDGQNLNLVMRFCDSGDLFQLLQETQNRIDAPPDTPGLTEGECRFWFRQIMDGVDFLHSKGICHRDLSPENIMIDGKEGVIIDMGMCLRVPYMDPTNSTARTDISGSRGQTTRCLFRPQGACGKLPYMDPVIYANRRPFDGAAADVWTCGTILFCMITGNRSYQRPHMSDPQFYWMTQGLRQLLSDWRVNMSEPGIALLHGMLELDPRLRLTIDEVRNHEWFNFPDEQPMHVDSM
jgi:serine/threonine protein kinase